MALFAEGPVQPNKRAIQLYLPVELATTPSFPLRPNGTYRARILPNMAVVLWPSTQELEYPLTIDAPTEIPPWTDTDVDVDGDSASAATSSETDEPSS